MYQANSDQNSVVVNTLIQPVEARFIRINIEEWHGHISMRFELYGCDVDAGGSMLLLLLLYVNGSQCITKFAQRVQLILIPARSFGNDRQIFFSPITSKILERFANDTCYDYISM